MNQSLNYGDQALSSAIRNKYMGRYSQGERRLAQTMRSAGQDDYLKKLQVTADMASQEHQMNLQKEILRQKKAQAKKAARGQVLGTVLGITGAVAGGFVGGGAGAMAGYQLGSGIGGAAGSM
jgi:hypothetical protein